MPLLSLRAFSLLALILVATAAWCAPRMDALIQGAKKEGAPVLYTSMTVDQAQKLNDAFKARYQISTFRAAGERLLTKIMTEAQAGRYGLRRASVRRNSRTSNYLGIPWGHPSPDEVDL
ncbi:MAG TPA: hypothetical protein VH985_02535 [Candidatus Binatia bacterium]|jgi:hypothetical protein